MELCNEHPPFSHNMMKMARTRLVKGTNAHLVICETLRLVYDLIVDMEDKKLREKIIVRLCEAMIMAKKISERLHYYRKKYSKDPTGNRGSGFLRTHGVKRRVRIRLSRRTYG